MKNKNIGELNNFCQFRGQNNSLKKERKTERIQVTPSGRKGTNWEGRKRFFGVLCMCYSLFSMAEFH